MSSAFLLQCGDEGVRKVLSEATQLFVNPARTVDGRLALAFAILYLFSIALGSILAGFISVLVLVLMGSFSG